MTNSIYTLIQRIRNLFRKPVKNDSTYFRVPVNVTTVEVYARAGSMGGGGNGLALPRGGIAGTHLDQHKVKCRYTTIDPYYGTLEQRFDWEHDFIDGVCKRCRALVHSTSETTIPIGD